MKERIQLAIGVAALMFTIYALTYGAAEATHQLITITK